MTTRIRECDERISAGRFRKALQFRDAAKTIREFADDEGEIGDAFVTLCVHAGIAAADTLCCEALGHHAQGDNHAQAITELSKVTPRGDELSNDLRLLLQMKPRAEYGPIPVTVEQRKRAWRRAERLVEAARLCRSS
ncbi:MAG TPA: hypothetical protein VF085_09330 [Solirubrobacterales bacterium]